MSDLRSESLEKTFAPSSKEQRKTQQKGPATHEARMAIRKWNRDRREPSLMKKRYDATLDAIRARAVTVKEGVN